MNKTSRFTSSAKEILLHLSVGDFVSPNKVEVLPGFTKVLTYRRLNTPGDTLIQDLKLEAINIPMV